MSQPTFPLTLNLTVDQAQALVELMTGVCEQTPDGLFAVTETYCHDTYHKTPAEMQDALDHTFSDLQLDELGEFIETNTKSED